MFNRTITDGNSDTKNLLDEITGEYEKAGSILARMRHITENYALPADACQSYGKLYSGLEALEDDLHTHIHLENNILFKKV